MTGPQGVLPAFGGHQDNPELGEVTGTWVAAIQADHDRIAGRIATELVAEQGGKAPAPGHARRRGGRSWFRRILPGPAASVPQHTTLDEPTMGYVAVGHLEHGTRHDPGTPEDGELRESVDEPGDFTQAVNAYQPEPYSEEDLAGRARIYAPSAINAVPLGAWDTPENREPMQRYVPDLNADLADLPLFRETLATSAASARESLFGCRTDVGTRGARMVLAGHHLFGPSTAGVFVWPDAAPADAAEAGIEEYDARHPVPAALAGGAA